MGLAPINTIIVIESLGLSDRKTGEELYDDIILRYKELFSKTYNQPLITRYFKAIGKKELLGVLTSIAEQSYIYPKGILIHLETHGSDDKCGLVLSNEELVSWPELQELLIQINVKTDNQFYLCMATCFGRYIHETIDHNLQAPFCAYISASEIISESEIIENFEPFFQELIKTRDAIIAYKNSKSEESNFYYKDIEVVYKEILHKIRDDFENPEYKKAFYHHTNSDFKRQFDNEVSEEEFELIFKKAYNDRINQIKNNFLFGKGRS